MAHGHFAVVRTRRGLALVERGQLHGQCCSRPPPAASCLADVAQFVCRTNSTAHGGRSWRRVATRRRVGRLPARHRAAGSSRWSRTGRGWAGASRCRWYRAGHPGSEAVSVLWLCVLCVWAWVQDGHWSDVRVLTAQRGRGHYSAGAQGHGHLARAR